MKIPITYALLFLLALSVTYSNPVQAANNNQIAVTIETLKKSIAESVNPIAISIKDLRSTQEANKQKLEQLEAEVLQLKSYKKILSYQQYRGNSFSTNSTTDVPTDAKVDITCSEACTLQVDYDVDTRNSVAGGINSVYTIYLDGLNQSFVNQASAAMENQAVPLSLNALIPTSAGNHTVQIYTRITNPVAQINEHTKTLSVVALSN